MFCLLVVLVKLLVLAKWLARKTPLRKPNHGEGIISIKPRPKRAYDCVGLLYSLVVLLHDICVLPRPCVIHFLLIWHDIAYLCWKCRKTPTKLLTSRPDAVPVAQPTLNGGLWTAAVTLVIIWCCLHRVKDAWEGRNEGGACTETQQGWSQSCSNWHAVCSDAGLLLISPLPGIIIIILTNSQDNVSSDVIMTTRSLQEFTRFIRWM